jgi:hypothetical protein
MLDAEELWKQHKEAGERYATARAIEWRREEELKQAESRGMRKAMSDRETASTVDKREMAIRAETEGERMRLVNAKVERLVASMALDHIRRGLAICCKVPFSGGIEDGIE